MPGHIFNVQNDSQLVEMNEEACPNEDVFQEMIARFPDLRAGDQIDNDSPRRWLLVKREMGVPCEEAGGDRWSVDHLFLDQDGIPTLVEVKRSVDTRIRREVVGQMLDYAANAVVYWPVESVRAEFEKRSDADERLAAFLNGEDPEPFWEKVKTNLQARKIRMLFVADVIPPELKRIVEFLNEQMDPAEVLALEIKQFVGHGLKTLVPRVYGQIEKKTTPAGKKWNEQSVLTQVRSECGSDAAEVAVRLLAWARATFGEPQWGRGARVGTFSVYITYGEQRALLFSLWAWGSVGMRLNDLRVWPPFTTDEGRQAILGRLNEIPNVSVPLQAVEPGIPLKSLKDQTAFDRFTQVIDWVVEQIRTQ